ncbi:MAG: CAP domain-containing protein [Pseudomonadota bacterium]
MRHLAFLLILALAACSPTPGTTRLSAGQTVDIASVNTQLSFQRAGQGITTPLRHSAALQAAAQAHAEDLAATARLGHNGSDGSSASDLVARSGYDACLTAENVAAGQPDIRSTVADWMSSPGHRSNILNPQVTDFGFGQSGRTRVLVLARPC